MPRANFHLQAPFEPAGDQPKAIAELTAGLERGDRFQTLLGVTGSGKTMTMANVIAQLRAADARPVAQQDARGAALRRDQELLPEQRGRVLHLVLRLLPAGSVRPDDRHVHREGRVDQRGHRPAAAARDVEPHGARRRHHRRHRVARSTASAIRVSIASRWSRSRKGQRIPRDDILRSLVKIQYNRNDVAFERGTFRVRGDTVEIFPAYEEQGVRVELWGDEIERISQDQSRSPARRSPTLERAAIYPAKHFVTSAPDARARGRADPRGARASG